MQTIEPVTVALLVDHAVLPDREATLVLFANHYRASAERAAVQRSMYDGVEDEVGFGATAEIADLEELAAADDGLFGDVGGDAAAVGAGLDLALEGELEGEEAFMAEPEFALEGDPFGQLDATSRDGRDERDEMEGESELLGAEDDLFGTGDDGLFKATEERTALRRSPFATLPSVMVADDLEEEWTAQAMADDEEGASATMLQAMAEEDEEAEPVGLFEAVGEAQAESAEGPEQELTPLPSVVIADDVEVILLADAKDDDEDEGEDEGEGEPHVDARPTRRSRRSRKKAKKK